MYIYIINYILKNLQIIDILTSAPNTHIICKIKIKEIMDYAYSHNQLYMKNSINNQFCKQT